MPNLVRITHLVFRREWNQVWLMSLLSRDRGQRLVSEQEWRPSDVSKWTLGPLLPLGGIRVLTGATPPRRAGYQEQRQSAPFCCSCFGSEFSS